MRKSWWMLVLTLASMSGGCVRLHDQAKPLPMRAFAAIPARSRYRFLLTEAEFSIMGFIKGPVCRGQLALNVIQDRFWIMFMDPECTLRARPPRA